MARRLSDRDAEMLEFCRERAISYEVENGELNPRESQRRRFYI
jgi:hypothetical protein